ncbi:MAG: hypothetical protein ACK5P5_02115 [Pseudobdellovibrionaceae bacterium]
MRLEIPAYKFDSNLRETPSSREECHNFISQCRTELAYPSPSDRKSVLAKLRFALRVIRKFYEAKKVFKEAISDDGNPSLDTLYKIMISFKDAA